MWDIVRIDRRIRVVGLWGERRGLEFRGWGGEMDVGARIR